MGFFHFDVVFEVYMLFILIDLVIWRWEYLKLADFDALKVKIQVKHIQNTMLTQIC